MAVGLSVEELQPGDNCSVGKIASLHTRGWLPYTLRWNFRVTDANYPYGFALEAWGVGSGWWRFEQDGVWVKVTYDRKIRADKPLLRNLSFLPKPVFSMNHRWAMAQGEKSLRAELARRRAAIRS